VTRHSPRAATDQRRSARAATDAAVSLRRFGQPRYRVRLFDLSVHGCRVEFVERPHQAERIWIRLEGLESLEARVRWFDEYTGGAEFARPIHPAVYEALLARLG
jgi:hypothetical protein